MNLIENFVNQMVTSLGLKPEELRNAIASIINDATTVKREVLGAKQGFGAAMQHFDQRLERIEASLKRLETLTGSADNPNRDNIPLINGRVEHD